MACTSSNPQSEGLLQNAYKVKLKNGDWHGNIDKCGCNVINSRQCWLINCHTNDNNPYGIHIMDNSRGITIDSQSSGQNNAVADLKIEPGCTVINNGNFPNIST